jgi:hypothetical protein
MATGRTVSASLLTDRDRKVIELSKIISDVIEHVLETKDRKIFREAYGKTSLTRDAGAGRGAGKLQRDALCTRGVTGKAPYSNRNLRWHPLVVAETAGEFAKKIERIEIDGAGDAQVLVFVVKDAKGDEHKYPSDLVHELPERYVVLPEHWAPHIDELKYWNDTLWTQNSCVITAFEACDWQDAIEAYAVLAISVATNFFKAGFDKLFEPIQNVLKNQTVDEVVSLPTLTFPTEKNEIVNCPLCKVPAASNPANLPDRKREIRFRPTWSGNKRGEGEDHSMQIMHVEALTERMIRHNAHNVRFGHRWCNVAMTDHSISETVDFMDFVVKAHNRK